MPCGEVPNGIGVGPWSCGAHSCCDGVWLRLIPVMLGGIQREIQDPEGSPSGNGGCRAATCDPHLCTEGAGLTPSGAPMPWLACPHLAVCQQSSVAAYKVL